MKILLPALALLAVSCAGDVNERSSDTREPATRAASDVIDIVVEPIETGFNTTLYTITSNYPATYSYDYLYAGGQGGHFIYSTPYFDNEWREYAGGPNEDLYQISAGTGQNSRFTIAAGRKYVWWTGGHIGSWTTLAGNEASAFRAISRYTRRGYDYWSVFGAVSRAVRFQMWVYDSGSQGGNNTFEVPIGDIVIATSNVDYTREVLITMSGRVLMADLLLDIYEEIGNFERDKDYPLSSATLYPSSDGVKIYVAGEKGTIYSTSHDTPGDWSVVDAGFTNDINVIYSPWESPFWDIIFVGGNNGELAYSTDGETFHRLDIGFGSNDIHDIYWYEPHLKLYVVGQNGRMAALHIN